MSVANPDLEIGFSVGVHSGAFYRPARPDLRSGFAIGPRVCLYI